MEEKKYTAHNMLLWQEAIAPEEDEQYKYDFINELILSHEARMSLVKNKLVVTELECWQIIYL